jgi:hypothetical protein
MLAAGIPQQPTKVISIVVVQEDGATVHAA